MSLLIISVLTTFMDFFLDIKVRTATYKAFADLGYIFNYKKLIRILEEEGKNDNLIIKFVNNFGPYIPFYNLFLTYIDWVKYTKYTEELVDIFSEYLIIEKMTSDEFKEYSLNKCGKTARKIERKMHKKRKNAFPVIYEDGSSIWYREDDNAEDIKSSIIVVDARGGLEKASDDMLVDMVYDAQVSFASVIMDGCEDYDDKIDMYVSDDVLGVSLDNFDDNKNNSKNKFKKRIRKK